MENSNYSLADLSAVCGNGCGGNQFNNPIWLIWALLFGFGGNGYGFGRNGAGQGLQDAEIMAQLNGIRDTMAANQNANALGAAIGANHEQLHGINAAINAASTANLLSQKDSAAQMASCCCDIKSNILNQTNQLQASIESARQATVNGFANMGYIIAQQTNELNTNATANTQRILDHLCTAETQALRDKLAQASQNEQTAYLISQLKTTA